MIKGQSLSAVSCVQTLTGTELLDVTQQRSPTQVQVQCYYIGEGNSPSPHSDKSSISINSLLPPKLTVDPPLITETDTVTLNCQTPSSVPVTQCFFRTVKDKPAKSFSCVKTLTGTELLLLAYQSSPAVVEVTCFYLDMYQSPESNTSSITIQIPRPKLTVNPPLITETESVTLNCQTPSSVSVTQCYLYIIKEETAKAVLCLQTLTGTELLRMAALYSSPAVVEVSCYYTTVSKGGQHQSRLSNIAHISLQKSSMTQRATTFSATTVSSGQTVGVASTTSSSISTSLTPVKPESETVTEVTIKVTGTTGTLITVNKTTTVVSGDNVTGVTAHEPRTKTSLFPVKEEQKKTWKWKLLVIVSGLGVIVGVVLLGLTLLCTTKSGACFFKRSQSSGADDYMHMRNIDDGKSFPADNDEGYNVITSVAGVDCTTGCENLNRQGLKTQQPQNEDSDTCHVYATISEEPAPSTLYNTVQAH
uniref:uncharacterized protein LOC109951928 n=1 Tax=Monopterus albus TaxID=43700 RepID=UPI0009B39A5C|nr:uncharacterized protein LOC109951928 [Monopterus albus]